MENIGFIVSPIVDPPKPPPWGFDVGDFIGGFLVDWLFKPLILLLTLLLVFLGSCSDMFLRYEKIHLDGYNYNKLQPLGEAQPPTRVDENGQGYGVVESIQVYLVGHDGNVDYGKSYEATAYVDDPERIFLHFDSVDWVKEGNFEEWTVPHRP